MTTTEALINAAFPNFVINVSDPEWLAERAILAPLIDTVASINKQMIEIMPGNSTTFISIDSTLTEEETVTILLNFIIQ
ncbi:ATP-dependent DNA helicase pif1 [Plakobranchus ocellatus]|uniref:ATP-dependent DNA helicase pif1 n=1 Tax=Plakobranchus ocellatus TaxID=259542 RepID=A0AAV3XV08_9GAST|nr:ATP-dependent DNA helicase pif1 [Plakobranchus ocellatus]